MNRGNKKDSIQSPTFRAEDFPSLDLAYKIALQSYEIAQNRFDSLDSRIQTLLAFGVTFTAAIPLLTKAKELDFSSVWFYASIGFFMIASILGVMARLWGGVKHLRPQTLYEHYLSCSTEEFMKDIIYWAGKHFDDNCAILTRKHRLTAFAMLCFLLEAPALVAWVAFLRGQ
jgi:hypothetical protein